MILMMASLVYTVVEYKPYGLLRDVGSWFYGFSLAYLALLGGAKIGTVLVVLSLPLFDFIWVIVSRLRN
jgi:UDP-N-acetylmuramyl pentapeptide phosphotransferase/UDP-N-acetylglucosamine-1-phosphate transferase